MDPNQFKSAHIYFFNIIVINLPPKFYSSTLNLRVGLFSILIRF